MLRISFQTLRANRGTLAGAFIAIWLGVTLAYAAGQLMAGALGAPGPGRFAAADAVVRADPKIAIAADESVDVAPAPLLDAALMKRFPGGVGDVSFPVGAFDAAGRPLAEEQLSAHGWASAALTPYTLTSGRAPAGSHEVVADARLAAGPRLRIATPAGETTYRVTGTVRTTTGPPTLFFSDTAAARLSGHPDKVNAIAIAIRAAAGPDGAGSGGRRVGEARGARALAAARAVAAGVPGEPRLEVLDRGRAADADASDPRAADRVALIAIFGTMGGICGMVALFVVAGTFSLAIVQRREEIAVLRALGAAPHQVRRLIAGEALIVSIVAGALGVLAGKPLARAIVDLMADHGTVPPGFAPGTSWIPLVASFGGGILIAQAAVFAAARRAGRTRPAEALREAAIARARPGVAQVLIGVLCLGGGVAMALVFTGTWAVAFAILEGLLLALGVGLLGRLLLGFPAALLAWPLRRLGASGLLASTGLAANRWRTAALATPVMLVAMLAGTQGIVQTSGQREAEHVTAARVTAPFVVVGRGGAPIPERTAERLDDVAVARTTEIYPSDPKYADDAPWPAAGLRTKGAPTLDLGFTQGGPGAVEGDTVAISHVFAETGHLEVGDTFAARLADTTRHTYRVGAIYTRAAGLGDVVLADVPAPIAAIFLRRPPALRDRGLEVLTRAGYGTRVHGIGNDQAWGVWMIVGLAALFAALALLNTARMATAERRAELATIRLLGGTRGQALRTAMLEMLPTMVVALAAGAIVVAISVHGVPLGLTGIPLALPVTVLGGVAATVVALGLATAAVTNLKRT